MGVSAEGVRLLGRAFIPLCAINGFNLASKLGPTAALRFRDISIAKHLSTDRGQARARALNVNVNPKHDHSFLCQQGEDAKHHARCLQSRDPVRVAREESHHAHAPKCEAGQDSCALVRIRALEETQENELLW